MPGATILPAHASLSAMVIIVASLCAPMFAQPQTGELRLLVRDPTGSAVRASGVISVTALMPASRFIAALTTAGGELTSSDPEATERTEARIQHGATA